MIPGWQMRVLEEVCDIVNGGTPKTSVNEYWNGRHLWITPAEMGKRPSPYVDNTERKITDLGLQDSSARMMPPNSVILSTRAPIGHLVINTKPMSTNQGCKGLVPKAQLDSKYLYYYLYSIVPLLDSLGTGATFKELSGTKLRQVSIPIAPVSEQKRIVAVLDKAFAAIAKAKANAEKNLENVRDLFHGYLDTALRETSSVLENQELGLLCELENGDRGENYPSRSIQTTKGVPFINAGHLTDSGIDFSEMNFIPKERFSLLGAGKIKSGDILFCLRGSLGKVASVGSLSEGAIASSLVIIRPKSKITPEYLLLYLKSRLCKNMIDLYSNGAAQPNLSAASLKKFVIPVPSISTQNNIVFKLEELNLKSKELIAFYNKKITNLEDLKKSILQKAFSGELVGANS